MKNKEAIGKRGADSVQRMVSPPVETFTDSQVECAVEQFLEYGEQQYQKSHQGYYSGPGWAARCLRYHLEQLKARRSVVVGIES